MNDQIRTLTLKCPGCGAALEVTPDMDRFACGYCGTEQIVQRRGGTVSPKLITDAISRVQTGTDRTAAELALVRLQQELAAIDTKLVQPLASLPPQPVPVTSNYAPIYAVISFFGLFVGLWFYAAESYKSLAALIVVWLALGIPWLIYASRVLGAAQKHMQAHVAALKADRERIVAQIGANKSIVQHAHDNDRNA